MARLPESPRPESYDLRLRIDPERERFSGTVDIAVALEQAASTIELHAVELDLREVTLRDSAGRLVRARAVLRKSRESVLLRLPRPLGPGRAVLHLAWEGPIRDDLRGLYLARSGRRRYATTQLEATDARRFFPCFDEPDKKARFRIEVTTPKRNAVVSNCPVERVEERGREKTVRFAETPKLSTYLVALIVGELEASRARRCGPTPIRVWHVPGKGGLSAWALTCAVESLGRLERYFDLPYPYQKLDLIAVPDFEFGAMENAGAVTFRESLLLLDPKTATLREKKRIAEVMAHELAHMWYGNTVTMAWWDDLWLNEAFATWMAFSVIDDWKPDWQMWLDFQQHRAAALSLDALCNTHPIYTEVRVPDEVTENFDAITYEKGASVVRMLERWLGPAAFRKGVRRYIRRHREANARAADLWNALEEASGRAVAPLVRAWIERPGFPLLEARRSDRGGLAFLEVRQERFFASPRIPEAARRERWPIPVVARVRTARGRDRTVRELVTRTRARIELGPSEAVRWAYANADEGGFYHPIHASQLLQRITAELQRLAPAERLGLLGHQWAGLRADRAPLEDFLELVTALGDEPEPEVLEGLAGRLASLADRIAPAAGKAAERRLQDWLADSFGPAFAELGWQPRRAEPDATRLRRAALLRIVGGIAEDPAVSAAAERQLRAYLRSRSALDPNLATPVVEIAAREGDKRLWEVYLRTMRRARTPQERTRFEMGLACFRDPALVSRTLELVLTDDVSTQDVAIVLVRLLGNRAAREATWAFVRDRWDDVSPRLPPGLAPRLVAALPALRTRAYRAEVAAFFRAHPLPTAKRALRQALERFDLEAEFRGRCAPPLRRWLAARGP